MKELGILCKSCGVSFFKRKNSSGELLGNGRLFCSHDCAVQAKLKRKWCSPSCQIEDQRFRQVHTKNGQPRFQRYCVKCIQTKVIRKDQVQV
jgi:hypothetical protein